jgi:hypothetical protein
LSLKLDRPGLRAWTAAAAPIWESPLSQSICEIADRIDGKVPTPVVGDDERDQINMITEVRRVIVDAKAPTAS